MTIATTHRPARLSEMGRGEAEEITKNIKDNFDSLGAMLVEARDRKAYKALGYRSFEAYCQNEFGKSVSSAYQLIEDAKVLEQLEAKLSEEYGENITLKMPASHLKPLKAIDNIEDKLKAIEYAQKLATGEGKKPTKQHLEIAVFEISGKRSEDFRSAIQKLGFDRGVPVQPISVRKGERGIIRNIDKAGLIYVEPYYGSNKTIPYRPTELRLLRDDEKPTNPLEGSIASKGDRVLIFAEGLQGKQGTIYTWEEGKTTLVTVDGQNSPTIIAYAEMELIQKAKPKNTDWESELVWESGKNTYYYFPAEDKIYSNQWPTGLTLTPYTHSGSPIDFIAHWENQFSHRVLESLVTPAKLKDLVIKQVIELSVDEGREFATDLINHLQEFIPRQNDTPKTALQQENQLLREQLAEAEAAIEAMILASTSSATSTLEDITFSIENTSEFPAPRNNTAPDDWKSILISNNFSRNYDGTEDCTEEYREWKIYLDPNEGYVELNHPQKGAFCCDTNFLNFELGCEGEGIAWAKEIINQVEDFCPGQLSLALKANNKNSAFDSNSSEYEQGRANVKQQREKVFSLLENNEKLLAITHDEKKRKKIKSTLEHSRTRLQSLKKFEEWGVGKHVTKINSLGRGTITKMEIAPGGMPIAWVKWQGLEGQKDFLDHHSLEVLQEFES
jgi:hypothetical protein